MRPPLLVDNGGMVFDGSSGFRTGIEEACDSGFVFCEDLDECWQTKDSWGGLLTESFNVGGTCITSDDKSLLFELLSLKLKHLLSWGVLCEELNNFWQTKDNWGGLMTKLLNGGGTDITDDDN